jgi:putative transposase
MHNRLFSYISGVCRKRDCMLLEGGGVADHVHLLIGMSMTKTIADLLRDIKANTSRWIHETWPEREFGWQDEYGAFSVGVSYIDKSRPYIRNQQEHQRKHTFEEELRMFVEMQGMRLEADGTVTQSARDSEDTVAPDGVSGAGVGPVPGADAPGYPRPPLRGGSRSNGDAASSGDMELMGGQPERDISRP